MKHKPRCICDGVLKHTLTWCKYHMECNQYYCLTNSYKLVTKGDLDDLMNKDWNESLMDMLPESCSDMNDIDLIT